MAYAHHTFAILLKGSATSTVAVAWAHASSPLRGRTAADPDVCQAALLCWDTPRLTLAALATAPHDPLLPGLRHIYNATFAEVQKVAREEASEGNASDRSDASLHLRTAAITMSQLLLRDLAAGKAPAIPPQLFRRHVGSATANLLGKAADAKPPWWDLEALVSRAKWPRLTRQTAATPGRTLLNRTSPRATYRASTPPNCATPTSWPQGALSPMTT